MVGLNTVHYKTCRYKCPFNETRFFFFCCYCLLFDLFNFFNSFIIKIFTSFGWFTFSLLMNTIRWYQCTSYRWRFFVNCNSTVAKIIIRTYFMAFYFKMRCHFCTICTQRYVTRPSSCTELVVVVFSDMHDSNIRCPFH